MQDRSGTGLHGATAPRAQAAARPGAATAAEQAAASPLLQALVARYLAQDDPSAPDTPDDPPGR